MKTLKSLSLIFFLTSSFSLQVHSQDWMTNGLVAFYPFNGDANDATGSGYDGVVKNATLTTDRFGFANHAYNFDGSSAYIKTLKALPDMQSASVSCWVKVPEYPAPPDYPANRGFFILMDGDNAPGHDFVLAVGSGTRVCFGTQDNALFGADVPPLLDRWFHIVAVANNDNTNLLKIWVNGQLAGTYPSSGYAAIGHHSELYIGCRALSCDNLFKGAMDDLRIYNRALSVGEIQQLYQYEARAGNFEIKVQPVDQTVLPKKSATFLCGVTNSVPYKVQWYFNGQLLSDIPRTVSGSQSETLKLNNIQPNQAGDYYLVAGNNSYSITSQVAHLDILTRPVITAQPNGSTNVAGTSVSFSVGAAGTQPLRYQWYHGWSAIRGATNSVLTLTNVQTSDAGSYRVAVMNKLGSIKSTRAPLKVSGSPKTRP